MTETNAIPEGKPEKFAGWISTLAVPLILVIVLGGNFLESFFGPKAELQIFPQQVRVEQLESVPVNAAPERPVPEPAVVEAPSEGPPNAAPEELTEPESRPLRITASGVVLHGWEPVAESAVWVTLLDAKGNSYLVGNGRTTDEGAFSVEGTVEMFRSAEARELRIRGKGGSQDQAALDEMTGEADVSVRGKVYRRNVKLSLWAVLGLPAVFFLSLWVAFLQARSGFRRRLKHLVALSLAFTFTASMVFALGTGLSRVHSRGQEEELLSLGYGFVFQGTYVEQGTPEWIFSFTSPEVGAARENPGSMEPVTGFGAPLWVILLSVIGSGIATVSLLVVGTKEPLDYKAATGPAVQQFRARIEQIVEHQFFILFAPLGAIFVYQMLVAAEAANRPVTVALAALGSGPMLNYLLARAISQAKSIIQQSTEGTVSGGAAS